MSRHHCSVLVGVMATSLTFAMPALAMETEITIDQDKAMAGGITPGDEPGFPIDINRPGRYVLKSNLYPGPSNGIEIRSPDVTIDFNGFRLQGFGQGGDGILAFGDTGTIMNGVIVGFGNNTLSGNNHGDVQVLNAAPLQPNVCRPRC